MVGGWTRLAGRGEWSLRFPSVFFGTLLVPLLWTLARRLFGSGRAGGRAALLAGLLAALSPLYTYYAQEARMYTLLAALGGLAGYCLLRAMAQPFAGGRVALRWWAAFALAAAAALYTHYFATFLLLAYALYFLWTWGIHAWQGAGLPAWRGLGTAVLSGVTVLVLYLPWLPAMLNRLRVDRSYWQGTLKLDEAVRHVAISYTMAAPETTLESVAVRWLPWFGLVFALCLAALSWSRWQPEDRTDLPAEAAERPSTTENYRAAGGSGRPGLDPPRLRRGGRGSGLPQRNVVDRRPGPNEVADTLPVFSERPRALLFLLLALAVPILGVLALASRTPKFNPRYLLLASPAYLLILAGGLGVLLSPGGKPRPRWWAWCGVAAGIVALALLVVVPAQAQQRWLSGDPSFTKAQWRELAAAVRRQSASDEAVLLVSGHAAPAWDYYAPALPAARLPDIDVLDVQAVLGFDSGPALAQALAGKSGAWVVFWQDQAVDPVGFVPYYLDRAGTEVPVTGQYWQLGLRHWRLRPAATYPDHAEPQHPDGANYAHKVALLGWDDAKNGQVTLYWQALNPIGAHDYQVSLHFEDASGREIPGTMWDGRPAGYDYPTDRWQPGRPLFGRYPLPKNLPPGQYFVTVALYDAAQPSGLDIMDVADNPAGKRMRLGPITVQP